MLVLCTAALKNFALTIMMTCICLAQGVALVGVALWSRHVTVGVIPSS